MLYLDTSLLVSALTFEANTDRVQAWLTGRDLADCAISDWVISEFSSALAIKMRVGHLTLSERAAALTTFHRMIAESLTVFSVERPDFRQAAVFSDHHEIGVRSGDALHLAVCSAHSARLATRDSRLATAGPAVGVETVLV